MYLEHFSLKAPPFGPAPGVQALYFGAGHREGMAALEWGLSEPSGLTMIAGEVGVGKSTLVEALVARSWRDVRVASVSDPALGYDEMLRVIAGQLGAAPSSFDRFNLLRAIRDLLAELAPEGRVAVIFDEAQALSDNVFDELRLLSNLGAGALAPLKIVLVGQPELVERLRDPRFRALNQRIGARAVLSPLSRTESAAYIEHRIRAAGSETRRIFTGQAIDLIVAAAQGLPRRINIICHNAMMTAFAVGHRRVRPGDAAAAIADYDDLLGAVYAASPAALPDAGRNDELDEFDERMTPEPPRRLSPIAIATAASAIIVFSAWYLLAAQAVTAQIAAGAVATLASDRRVSAAPLSSATAVAAQAPPSSALIVTNAIEPQLEARIESAPSSAAAIANARAGAAWSARAAARARTATNDVLVRTGDTLGTIARSYLGSDSADQIARLMRANPQIDDSNLIFPGETVTLAPRGEEQHEGGSR